MPTTIRPWSKVYQLSVRVLDDHGGPVAQDVKDPGKLATSSARHVLLLVHGFNNTAEDARASYKSQMDLLQKGFGDSNLAPDAIAHFQWPGDLASISRFTDWLLYPDDITQSLQAARRLAGFLVRMPAPSAATRLKVSFIGHSLGCRLILEALKRLNAPAITMDVMSLMAAAVPIELVGSNSPLVGNAPAPRRRLKFFSENDLVLRFGFPAGQQLAFIRNIEIAAYGEAVGLHGNPPNFGEATRRYNGHGDYWDDAYAAGVFVSAIDSSKLPPPNIRAIPSRSLPLTSEIPERDILTRDLPN